jgi:class 3 adenylate cyclase/tetratricopeptide (TPR) repeat protein
MGQPLTAGVIVRTEPDAALAFAPTSDTLVPFASILALDWVRDTPDVRYRSVPGTLVFADISGFTRLTERLAAKGRVGAEEMSDHLDAVLSTLLDAASAYGGWLVKWGGDALLLMFDGPDDAARACAASDAMRRAIADTGRLDTSVGRVRLRMSVGIHTGVFEFVLVGTERRELLITGDAATVTAGLEATAEAGEVLLSQVTAKHLPPTCRGPRKGDGVLLDAVPGCEQPGRPSAPELDDDAVAAVLPPLVAAHVRAGGGNGEHHHVAVAFVEFRGIGELSARRGPAGVVDALEHLVAVTQTACARYGVSLHETDIGPDGGKLMLVAGAPMPLDDPCESMLCVANEVVTNPGVLAVRVGVTTGRVFAGAVGPAYRRSYSVKGDTVNLAARIMGKAATGEVWALPAVTAASRTQFALSPLEPFAVKGKKLPVTAVAVGDPVARVRAGADLPCIGRIAELARLWASAVRAGEGHGSVIELVGSAGTGKTRIVAESAHLARALSVIGVGAEPYRATTPYAVVRPMLLRAMGLGAGDADVLRTRLQAWCEAVAPELAPWLPLLGTAIDVELPETPETRDLGEEFRRPQVERAVVDALTAALPHPTLITVDDAQYADEASAGVLRAIAAVVAERPWLLVVARRPDDGAAPLVTDSNHMVLGPLDDDEATLLVDAETREHPLSDHIAAAVLARAGGNPMFLRELARAAAAGGDAQVLPETIEDIVVAQVGQLPPRDRDVLRAASVIGMTVDPVLLTRLLAPAESTPPAEVRLDGLQRFLTREGAAWRFRQALAHAAAYHGLPFRRRLELHSRLADLLSSSAGSDEDATLSLHFFEAGRYAEAAVTARTAAERAARLYANVEAAALYERAIAATRRLTGPDAVPAADMAALVEHLADVQLRLGDFDAADASYARARRLLPGDRAAAVRIALKTVRSASHQGDYPKTLRRLRSARTQLDGTVGPEYDRFRADVAMRAAYTRWRQGRLQSARSAWLEVLATTNADMLPDVVADALGMLDMAEIGLGLPSDPTRAARALQLYERLGDLADQARVLNQMGYRAYFAGDWVTALSLYERSRDLLDRIGNTPNAAVLAANIAEILVDQGRSAEAETMLRTALHTWRAAGAWNDAAFGYSLLGRALSRQGQYDEGRQMLAEARRHFAAQDARTEIVDADTYLAESLLLEGRNEEALDAAQNALAQASALAALPAQGPLLYRVVGGALDALGRPEEAAAAYGRSLEIARQRNAGHDVAFTLTAIAARARAAGQPVDPSWLTEVTELGRQLGLVVHLDQREPRTARIPAQRLS